MFVRPHWHTGTRGPGPRTQSDVRLPPGRPVGRSKAQPEQAVTGPTDGTSRTVPIPPPTHPGHPTWAHPTKLTTVTVNDNNSPGPAQFFQIMSESIKFDMTSTCPAQHPVSPERKT